MMRNTIFLYVLFISIFTASCEDVVDIELNYSNERLVIEGQLNWIKETKQTEQFIILSKTTPYFENQRIPANNAQVEIIDQKNNIYKFEELNETGTYFPLDTIPYNLGSEYTLQIDFENQKYRGSEILNRVAQIIEIKQDSIPIFGNMATQLEALSLIHI